MPAREGSAREWQFKSISLLAKGRNMCVAQVGMKRRKSGQNVAPDHVAGKYLTAVSPPNITQQKQRPYPTSDVRSLDIK